METEFKPTSGPAFAVVFALAVSAGCSGSDPAEPEPAESRFRQDMRLFVQAISDYAKGIRPGFVIIPQNGQELVVDGGDPAGAVAAAYVAAIDGLGREDLFYGYDADDLPTPTAVSEEIASVLDVARQRGKAVLVTDYVRTRARVDDSYARNAARGYISFAAPSRDLDLVPDYPAEPRGSSGADVTSLEQARNFLYLLDTSRFEEKEQLLAALEATRYDVLILDAFFHGTEPLLAADVTRLQRKRDGGRRLVVAYMSIGEAENYRFYWQSGWKPGSPAWLDAENPSWRGNYKVKYWDPEWQRLIFGEAASYTSRLLDAGFDGAYLDIIDAFDYFEDRGG